MKQSIQIYQNKQEGKKTNAIFDPPTMTHKIRHWRKMWTGLFYKLLKFTQACMIYVAFTVEFLPHFPSLKDMPEFFVLPLWMLS